MLWLLGGCINFIVVAFFVPFLFAFHLRFLCYAARVRIAAALSVSCDCVVVGVADGCDCG